MSDDAYLKPRSRNARRTCWTYLIGRDLLNNTKFCASDFSTYPREVLSSISGSRQTRSAICSFATRRWMNAIAISSLMKLRCRLKRSQSPTQFLSMSEPMNSGQLWNMRGLLMSEYLTALQAIEATGRDGDIALERLDRQLRDRTRVSFGLTA